MNASILKCSLLVIVCCSSSFLLHAQHDSLYNLQQLNELSFEQLMNIEVVTASRIKQKISEAPSTMRVITAQQIEERGYEQLDDVLRDMAGVDLIHIYGRAPTFITFRGMYGDENRRLLFMIDGVIENNIMGDFAMAGPAYSLHNVERIEIIWGPGSALYGANAFGAVINIITKKGEEAQGFHFQKAYGSYNTSTENLMLGIKKSNVDFVVSGSLYNSDGPYFSNRHPQYSNSYVDNAWSFNSTLDYTLKKLKTTLGIRSYTTPGGWGEPLASPTLLLGLPDQGNNNSGKGGMLQSNFNGSTPSLAETISRTAFLQGEYKPTAKLLLFTRLQYRTTELTDKTYFYLNSPGTNFFSKSIGAYYSNRVGAELSGNCAITQHQQVSAGLQFSQDNLEKGFREIIPDNKRDTIENIIYTNVYAGLKPRTYTIQNNIGAYLQYVLNTTLLNKTNFTIGARYDYNTAYGKTMNPRVGIINQPNDAITLKILYGTAYRAPTNFELYTATTGVRISNLDLKPEKIQTYEANIIYAPLKILSVQLNVFHNQLNNVIIHDVPVGLGLTQNQNSGTATISGLEAKADLAFSRQCTTFLNFTYQEGTQFDGATTTQMPNIAKLKGNVGITIHINNLFSINIIENWVGIRSVALINPYGNVSEFFNTNLTFSTSKFFKNRVSASISIRNLLNQTYYDPGIRAADGNFYATVMEQPKMNGLFKISISL
ncbi:MAG TPA: TonB-dependent receptor [Bacteroidia bacterium]|jgi:iron complex outermembrane receptor protein|nr:TonB-dependent receptor [Bacteroidia bacterium]